MKYTVLSGNLISAFPTGDWCGWRYVFVLTFLVFIFSFHCTLLLVTKNTPVQNLQDPVIQGVVTQPNHTTNSVVTTVPCKVVLVTYHRGGSTFLGQLFNQNPLVDYWFEPLRPLYLSWYQAKLGPDDLSRLSVDILHHLLSCQLHMVLSDVMKDDFVSKSHNAHAYTLCMTNKSVDHYEQCLYHRKEECIRAKIRVIKTIRLTLKAVWQLLTLDPDVKVIWYVRDPRPSMLSKLSLEPNISLSQAALDRCSRMENDLQEFGVLKKAYPHSVMQLRYEDLVVNPIMGAQALYRFVGHHMPASLSQWIQSNTQAQTPDLQYGTKRNSTETMNRWRTVITLQQKNTIDTVCKTILQRLAYM